MFFANNTSGLHFEAKWRSPIDPGHDFTSRKGQVIFILLYFILYTLYFILNNIYITILFTLILPYFILFTKYNQGTKYTRCTLDIIFNVDSDSELRIELKLV